MFSMTNTITKQLPARLPISEYEALKAYAESTGTSMNDVMVKAVAEYLGSDARKAEIQARIEAITQRHSVALEKLATL
jgi:uncharacterized protein (DUF1778 family)